MFDSGRLDHRREAHRGGDPFVTGSRGGSFRLEAVSLRKSGRTILDGIDLDLPAGRITALLGSSGSGKTSLLRLLNRLDDPTSGTILYAGRLLSEYPVSEFRRRVAFVFQTPTPFPGTVRDNLLTAGSLGAIPDDRIDRRLREAARLAQLDPELLDRDAHELSVGQQQRAMIARALVNQPTVLLLDEATAALDTETAGRLLRVVRYLAHDRGLTVIMSTHRLHEARTIGDSRVRLTEGRIVEGQSASAEPARPSLAGRPEEARTEAPEAGDRHIAPRLAARPPP